MSIFIRISLVAAALIALLIQPAVTLARAANHPVRAPRLLSPKPGSVLTTDRAKIRWSSVGARGYDLIAGSQRGRADIARVKGIKGTAHIIRGLPSDGRKLFLRITARFKSKGRKRMLRRRQYILHAFKKAIDSPGTKTPPPPAANPQDNVHGTLSAVWANDGGDKVTRDELRATSNPASVTNSTWDGGKIKLFGARNEVVAFNLILEAGKGAVENIDVKLDRLEGPSESAISSSPASSSTLFDWTERDIELFYMRYLPIRGLSRMSYESYDERHIPYRMRRPFTGEGFGNGTWYDRPDHDKYYPDIAVPLELVPNFKVESSSNQSIWADIYIPKDAQPGIYSGTVEISEGGKVTREVPIELTVKGFTLPDMPSAKTMLFIGRENISKRFTGVAWPNSGSTEEMLSKEVQDQFFKLAHRHKISLIDAYSQDGDAPAAEWLPRLDGGLFTAENGYRGPGEGVGNNVYSIGTYGTWSWKSQGEEEMRAHTDAWANWFEANSPQTEYFLYLVDESNNYEEIEQWSQWIENNPGPGQSMRSFATIWATDAQTSTPSLDIAATGFTVGDTSSWQNAIDHYKSDPSKRVYFYNGKRPANGSFAIDDDGVALRELPWAQYKMGIDRWFKWESTYYNDYQSGRGETNVFENAQTFGVDAGFDEVMGHTGWNYSNGDGVLFYPGTDTVYPEESFGVAGPFASLRLKSWRRGLQDHDYLTMASAIDPVKTQQIVAEMVPKALWEYGIANPADPTWVRADISWSTDPDVWEKARAQLAQIIEGT